MNQPSNTPPDGDFVRYVERLTAANAARVLRQAQPSAAPPPRASSALPVASSRAVPAAAPQAPVLLPAAAPAISGGALLGHLRWAIAIFFVVQLLGAIVPALGWLLVPALLAYAGWAVYHHNRESSGALFARLRELAEEAQQQNRKP